MLKGPATRSKVTTRATSQNRSQAMADDKQTRKRTRVTSPTVTAPSAIGRIMSSVKRGWSNLVSSNESSRANSTERTQRADVTGDGWACETGDVEVSFFAIVPSDDESNNEQKSSRKNASPADGADKENVKIARHGSGGAGGGTKSGMIRLNSRSVEESRASRQCAAAATVGSAASATVGSAASATVGSSNQYKIGSVEAQSLFYVGLKKQEQENNARRTSAAEAAAAIPAMNLITDTSASHSQLLKQTCPICNREYPSNIIEDHASTCVGDVRPPQAPKRYA